jgi:hypothetical protein
MKMAAKPKTVTVKEIVQLADPRVERLVKFWSGVGKGLAVAVAVFLMFVGLASILHWWFSLRDWADAFFFAFMACVACTLALGVIGHWWECTAK